MIQVPMLFPGQGSQAVGMTADLVSGPGPASDFLATVNDVLDTNLMQAMHDGPGEVLTETRNAQPAILAHSVAITLALREMGVTPSVVAGHSIGEFSAAVADNSGAGGLLEDITHHRIPLRYAYLLILLVTVALTWETDVNGIISYASRAFALFYMLQCVVAFLVAWELKDLSKRPLRLVAFGFLALACLLVFSLGLPSE